MIICTSEYDNISAGTGNIERNLEGEEERTTYGGKEIDPNKLK